MNTLNISPHQDFATYSEAELASDIDFEASTSKLSYGSPAKLALPRSIFVAQAGGGTLVVETNTGPTATVKERAHYFLTSGAYADPSPCSVRKILATSTAFDADAVFMVDDTASPSYTDETEDFNDAGTADVAPMPATEVADVDGLLIGSSSPFNMLTLTLSQAGVGGTLGAKVYTGNPDATLDYANFSAVTTYGAGRHMTASGDLWFDAPNSWRPVSIDSSDKLYWLFLYVATTFSTNPVLSQGRLKHRTNVGMIRVAP